MASVKRKHPDLNFPYKIHGEEEFKDVYCYTIRGTETKRVAFSLMLKNHGVQWFYLSDVHSSERETAPHFHAAILPIPYKEKEFEEACSRFKPEWYQKIQPTDGDDLVVSMAKWLYYLKGKGPTPMKYGDPPLDLLRAKQAEKILYDKEDELEMKEMLKEKRRRDARIKRATDALIQEGAWEDILKDHIEDAKQKEFDLEMEYQTLKKITEDKLKDCAPLGYYWNEEKGRYEYDKQVGEQ